MAFSQNQHEAHDPNVNLTQDQCEKVLTLFEGYESNDEGLDSEIDNICNAVGEVRDAHEKGEDVPPLQPDIAARLAQIIREQHLGDDETDLLSAIDSVAKQHDMTGGKTHTSSNEPKH
jgi:hypothetical protein